MDITILLATLLILAALVLFPRIVRRARFVRLVNKIPGPPSYPLLGTVLPYILAPRNKQSSVILNELRKYQPIIRTWTGSAAIIYITRPEIFETFINSTKHLDKSFVYKFVLQWLGTGLLTSTGEKWHTHRKMITPTFHFKILDSFVEVFSEKSKILISKLQKEVGSVGFDVYPYITRCALDIICETAMGTPVHAQEGANSEYVTAVCDMSELVVRRVTRPWLHSDTVYKLTKEGKRYAECLNILHSFTKKEKPMNATPSTESTKSRTTTSNGTKANTYSEQEVIQERKWMRLQSEQTSQPGQQSDDIGKKKRVAFLDMLLEASVGDKKLTDEEIREEVDTFMFEGHDTTSAAICWALFLLGLHPDIQDKAYEELEEIFEGSDRPPSMKDLNEMKYLEKVIKESLRLYPSVPNFSRLIKEDIEIGGYTIPAGCSIRISVYMNHRNPDQFPNPEKFDPDNFLPERVAKRHPYAYIPFSAGPRNCIGQKFAMLEEKTVLSYMLRHYRLRSVDRREDINTLMELIMRPENGIRLRITPRTKGSTKV